MDKFCYRVKFGGLVVGGEVGGTVEMVQIGVGVGGVWGFDALARFGK